MSVAIRKIEGVDSVTVSLNEGLADVELKPGNTLDPEGIREAVRTNGFTPKAADVRVTGRIIEQGGKLALSVTGLGILYEIVEHPDAKGKLGELEKTGAGSEVTLSGRLPEADAGRARDATRVLELSAFARVDR